MKKKIFLFIIALSFLIFAGRRIYWYCRNDCNNLVFVLSNYMPWQYGEDKPVAIEIYIDDQLYYQNSDFSDFFLFIDDKNVPMGSHRLKVVVNSHFVAIDDFFVFPITWIMIECWGRNGVINDVMFWFSSSPPGLMI